MATSATSSLASTLNSRLRMSGLSSGLDIDGMVTKLMTAEKAKGDKLYQKRTYLQWQQDAYRSVTSLVQGFSSDCFDVLNPATNIRSQNSFNAYKSTYDTADTSPYLTMTAGSGALTGNYTISNIKLAEVARTAGIKLAGNISGNTVLNSDVANISSANDNNKVKVTFNGTTKEIVIPDGLTDVDDLRNSLQASFDDAFGKDASGNSKINVVLTPNGSSTGGSISFNTALSTDSFSINYSNNTGSSEIFGPKLSSGITLTSSNNKFKVTLGNGTAQDIVLDPKKYNTSDELAAAIESKINANPALAGIRVLNQGDVISLKAMGVSIVNASGPLVGASLSGGTNVTSANQNISVSIDGGPPKTISIDIADYTGKKGDLLANIQSKLDGAFGANKTMVSMNTDGTLRFESVSSTEAAAITAKENGGLDVLGFKGLNTSDRLDLNAHIADIMDKFSTGSFAPGTPDAKGNDIKFTVNGKDFSFNSATTSINDIISAVNADSDVNITMKYDSLNDKISIESKQTGTNAKIQISDSNGNLMSLLGLNGISAVGKDSSMTYNYNNTGDQTVVRSNNDFAINGVSFSLKQANAGSISVNVASDPSKTMDLIKNFVDKYNTLIEKINGLLTEKKDSDYTPLTDEQKEAMKDSDVTTWETKAKQGILNNDSILSGMIDSMRNVLYDTVPGVTVNGKPLTLSSIGITTGSYLDKGKLVIDEDKLKAAITANPDQVTALFTKSSTTTYSQSINDTTLRSTRYNESGVAQRLYDVIQDNIRTSRNSSGQKGSLLEKAGIAGDLSEYNNTVYTQIQEYDEEIADFTTKLADKQEAYYAKFSAMETALQNMNSQSQWLSQQFG